MCFMKLIQKTFNTSLTNEVELEFSAFCRKDASHIDVL